MNAIVFYRSNKVSSSIASSTKYHLEQNKNVKDLNVEFVNLDKRNYKKFLSSMEELPSCVYVWCSEKEVINHIRFHYPSIEIVPFDRDNAIEKDENGYYPTKEYTLVNLIISKYKETLPSKERYVVDSNYQLSTKEMNDLDVVKAIKNHMRVFDRKEEAEDYVVASLENRMSRIRNEILDCREQIRSYQKEFREIEKYLNAFQNIIKEREEEREL